MILDQSVEGLTGTEVTSGNKKEFFQWTAFGLKLQFFPESLPGSLPHLLLSSPVSQNYVNQILKIDFCPHTYTNKHIHINTHSVNSVSLENLNTRLDHIILASVSLYFRRCHGI